MNSRLFIIGNGFDCAHHLPVHFDPDFKNIARKYETSGFWEIYQSQEYDIWSDFENLLAQPDYNFLEKIFDGYHPDYLSDKESDRDSIIVQSEISGNLSSALSEFAEQAESSLIFVDRKPFFVSLFKGNDYYINFNYTHTLESIYSIDSNRILHIHGETGLSKLLLGFPEGNFSPATYMYDARMKGVGPYSEEDISDYIDSIDDFYKRTAYENLYNKCKSFSKPIQLDLLNSFISNIPNDIIEIIIYGHSCAIDFAYFEYIKAKYPFALWVFYVWDGTQKYNIHKLITILKITNYKMRPIRG